MTNRYENCYEGGTLGGRMRRRCHREVVIYSRCGFVYSFKSITSALYTQQSKSAEVVTCEETGKSPQICN